MAPLDSEVAALRRAVEQLKRTRDHDHKMFVSIIDRIEGDIRQLKATTTGLIVNEPLRTEAATVVVDSQHAINERLNQLQASIDFLFRNESTIQ
jgi:hypothetical protein